MWHAAKAAAVNEGRDAGQGADMPRLSEIQPRVSDADNYLHHSHMSAIAAAEAVHGCVCASGVGFSRVLPEVAGLEE